MTVNGWRTYYACWWCWRRRCASNVHQAQAQTQARRKK